MKTILTLLSLSVFLLSQEAHAIRITNLDHEPRKLIVDNAGEVIEVMLAPGGSYNTFGPMVDLSVSKSGKVTRAKWNGDYAIWPGGRLYLQSIRDSHHR